MLHDRHGDAGRGQSFQSLVRVHEQRRRVPDQDLVRVMVKCDDRGRSVTTRRLISKVTEQVGMSKVQPIEDADDDEGGTETGRQMLDALDDFHRAQSTGTVAGSDAAAVEPGTAGLTNTLSGARRVPSAVAMAASRPSGLRSR